MIVVHVYMNMLTLNTPLPLLQIVVPPLPGKALKRLLPFRGDEGIFEESFIEERRVGLEQFINRSVTPPNGLFGHFTFANIESA